MAIEFGEDGHRVTSLMGRGSPGARLRDMGRGNHAITALEVIKGNQVKMIKNS